MKMIKLLLILLMYQIYSSYCGEGCLSCNDQQLCILCDKNNGFYLDSTSQTCVKFDIDNCLSIDTNGVCQECADQFFFYYKLQKCFLVSSQLKIENCILYGPNQDCEKCDEGYYLLHNNCEEITEPIDNCIYYSQHRKCTQCQPDYIPSMDGNTCIQYTQQDNCKAYTNLECTECKDGYQQNDNKLKQMIQDKIQNYTLNDLDKFVSKFLTQDENIIQDNCYQNYIPNCKKYKDHNTCLECNDSYKVYNNQCYKAFENQIPNCKIQKDSQTCLQCKDGFGFIDQQCKQIDNSYIIDNCFQYQQFFNDILLCTKCKEGYFLNSSQNCQQIYNSIEYCESYSDNHSLCEKCEVDYAVSSDQTQCLYIDNSCYRYEPSEDNPNEQICVQCFDGYYFQNGLCQQGTIDFCKIYYQNQDLCKECQDDYILNNNECQERHYKIQDCKVYNEDQKTCKECNDQHIQMGINVICSKGTIENCETYSLQGVCLRCKDGYTLDDDNNCEQNQTENDPLIIITNECNENQLMKEDSCYDMLEYQYENCKILNDDITSVNTIDQQCQICKQNSIPYNLKDNNICLTLNELKLFDQNLTSIENCDTYTLVDTEVRCLYCKEGFILDDNSCLEQCQNESDQKFNSKFQEDNDLVNYQQQTICIPKQTEVKTFVQNQDLDPTPYELQDNYFYVMKQGQQQNHYKILEPELITNTNSKDLFYMAMHDSIINLPTDQQIDNCKYYKDQGDQEYKCQVCNFGYYGEIFNICNTEEECVDTGTTGQSGICENGARLNEQTKQCEETVIQNCDLYQVNTAYCLRCADNYYRQDLTTCVENTIENCQIKNKFQNTCLKCNSEYIQILNSDNDIIQCAGKIQNCIQHNSNNNNELICNECEQQYYPSEDNKQCTLGDNNCMEYDQSTKECLYYKQLNIIIDQTCSNKDQLYGCLKISSDNQSCDICQSNKYKFNNQCCDFETYRLEDDDPTGQCTGGVDDESNCQRYISIENIIYCQFCKENFILDIINNKCTPVNQQYINDQLVDKIQFEDLDITNCSLYDFKNKLCLACGDNQYYQNQKCCQNGTYNNNDTCESIENLDDKFSNCLQLSNDNNNCILCVNSYSLQGGICCDLQTQIIVKNINQTFTCQAKSDDINCNEYYLVENQQQNLRCQNCPVDYFLVENDLNCCKKVKDDFNGQYYNLDQNQCQDIQQEDVIENCSAYDSNKQCVECLEVDGQQLYTSDGQHCCMSQQIYHFDNCISLNIFFENCKLISTSQDNYCTECKDGYYKSNNVCTQHGKYFPIDQDIQNFEQHITQDITQVNNLLSTNCIEITDDKQTCQKCKEGYDLDDNSIECIFNEEEQEEENNNEEFVFTTIQDTCFLIDLNTNQCYDNYIFNDDIKVHCKNTQSYQLFSTQGKDICCLNQQQISNNQCVDKTIPNCIFLFGTTCYSCSEGYQLLDNECIPYDNNCALKSNNICTKCNENYQLIKELLNGNLNDSSCIELNDQIDQKYCKVYEIDQQTNEFIRCTKCFNGSYLDDIQCCKYGTYYDQDQNQCINILQDNLTKMELSIQEQDECDIHFLTQDNLYRNCDITQQINPLQGQMNFRTFKLDQVNQNLIQKQFYKDELDYLCQLGYYYSQNQCIQIDTSLNCVQGMEDFIMFNFVCTQCQENYYLTNNNCCQFTQVYDITLQQCVENKVQCSQIEGYYLSNNQCCKENQYYNTQQQKCMYHPDQYCIQSNSQYECDICQEGYQSSQYYVQIQIDFNTYHIYNNIQQQYILKPCIQIANDNSIPVLNIKYKNNIERCETNDDNSIDCNQCKDGFNLKNKYCCTDDEFHSNGICIQKQKAMNQCKVFDIENYQCIECNKGYHISHLYCCQDGYEYNNIKQSCVRINERCTLYNNILGRCLEYNENYYELDQNVCQLNYYYDEDEQKCIQYENEFEYCNEGKKEYCLKCKKQIEIDNQQYNIYKSQKTCCLEGQYYNELQNQCIDIQTDQNCLKLNDNNKCIKCQDENYYLVKNYQKCCMLNTYYDGNDCIDLTGNCKKGYKDDQDEIICQECLEDFYLTNGKCCQQGQYYLLSSNQCVDIYRTQNCLQEIFSVCQKCDNANNYFIQQIDQDNECCPQNQIYINGSCQVSTNDKLKNCNVFKDENNCRKLTQQEKEISNLTQDCIEDNQYVTNGSCCNKGMYFNQTECTNLIELDNSYENCEQIDDQNNCYQCKASEDDIEFYISNFRCCQQGQYFDIEQNQCLVIDQDKYNDCNKYQDECTSCLTNILNDSCCQENTTNTNDGCVQNFDHCLKMKSNQSCEQCNENYYITNGHCCQDGQVFTNNQCEDIEQEFSQIENCSQINDTTQQDLVCNLCNNGYLLSNGRCCQPNYIYENDTCVKQFETCIERAEDQSCIECLDNYQLFQGGCCSQGYYYDDNQNICLQIEIQNCAELQDINNCKKCFEGFNLQNNVCCQEGYILVDNKCVNQQNQIQDCKYFNTQTLKCEECIDDYYKLNESDMCCEFGTYYDDNQCKQNQELCKKQQNQQCQTCNDGSYLTTFNEIQKCCEDNKYLDITQDEPTCEDIELDKCLQGYINEQGDEFECIKYEEVDCPNEGEVYSYEQEQCISQIQNCKTIGNDSNSNVICLECLENFTLSSDKFNCCQGNNFIQFETYSSCQSELSIQDTGCGLIDLDNLQCSKCLNGFYLSDGICCQDGKFKQLEDTQECTGEISIDNCLQQTNDECIKCQNDYTLNDQNQCVKIIQDCVEFSDLSICLKCKDDILPITSHCCSSGQIYNEDQCQVVDTEIQNCLEYDLDNDGNIQCKQCQDNYYFTDTQLCCEYGKYCSDDQTSEDGEIENCQIYDTSKTSCKKCNQNYSLLQIQNQDKCIEISIDNCIKSELQIQANNLKFNCQECSSLQYVDSIEQQEQLISYLQDIDNCEYPYLKNPLTDMQNTCARCDEGYYLDDSFICQLRTIGLTNCIQYDYFNDACLKCEIGYKINNNECQKIEIQNCSLASNEQLCATCQQDFQLIGSSNENDITQYSCTTVPTIDENTDPYIKNKIGIIINCEQHTQCNNNIYLNGLDPEISKYLSCHVCNDNDRIPFLQLKFDYDTIPNNQLENGILITHFFHNQDQNHSSECFKKDLTEFSLDEEDYVFPDNCGIGAVNGQEDHTQDQSNQNNVDINTTKLSIFCVACKPGFKPLYSNLNYHVVSCIEIQNCQTSENAFNQCDICNEGYAFKYIQDKELDKSICIEVPIPQTNCYVYDQENEICKVCQNGYDFNLQGMCEKLEIPKCKEDKNNQQSIWQKNEIRLAYYRGLLGCQECQDNYHKFYQDQDDYVCIDSPYNTSNDIQDELNNLTKHCLNYQIQDNEIQCIKCKEGYEIYIDYDQNISCRYTQKEYTCQHLDLLQFQDNKIVCQECIEGYYPSQLTQVFDICYPMYQVEGCKIYDKDISSPHDIPKCLKCQHDYYYQNDECIKRDYYDSNCYKFQLESDGCDVCKEGYYLDENQNKCFEYIIQIEGCYLYSDTGDCILCQSNYYLKDNECHMINEDNVIDNCLEHNESLECQKCQENYYKYEGNCLEKDIENCQNQIGPNNCQKCVIDHKIVVDESQNQSCQQIDIIDNCDQYQQVDPYVCLVCNVDYYSSDQGLSCIQVEENNLVDQCMEYNSQQECIKCQQNYYLTQDMLSCVRLEVENQCLNFQETSQPVCSLCETGYSLNDQNQCVEDQEQIDGCLIARSDDPSQCAICQPEFYMNEDGNCQEISPIILP